ncbi:MAG: filamentous hemagglutinin N-terminal domain-containing protein [Cyanobacteria bacterium P01_F01_bin.150]
MASAHAQVIPDLTLENPSKVNESAGSVIEITGGTRAANNFFHSFESFSIPEGRIASFQSVDSDINAVISRVTGSNRSDINGLIQVLNTNGQRSTADLFLLNPNGIVFGPNARLNLGGSFVATTAEQLVFADGTAFGIDNKPALFSDSSMLTINAPVGLQFGQHPASIRVRSQDAEFDPTGFQVQNGLAVDPSQTLALVGGTINLSNGILNAQSGRIELGSVGDFATVELIQSRRGLNLAYNNVEDFRDIRIGQRSLLNISGTITGLGAGTMQIHGRRVIVNGSSSLLANTIERGDLTGISIRASTLRLQNSLISSTIFGSGQSGNINIQTDALAISNGAQIFANVAKGVDGDGGNINITADSLEIIESPIAQDSNSGGSNRLQSGIRASVLSEASGNGGNIQITTNTLEITEGGQIVANTLGAGNTGRIRVDANDIQITGVAMTETGTPIIGEDGLTVPSTISALATEDSIGRGGDINITAQNLRVDAGATIQTSTVGAGNAGNVNINVTGSSRLNGTIALTTGNLPSGLYSFSGGVSSDRLNIGGNTPTRREATGQGGTISLNTGELVVGDRAVIAVGSLNPDREDAGGAGRIAIRAGQIRLDDEAALLSATASGDGGNIEVNVDDTNILLLRQESLIESTAGLENAGGNGGNIAINAGFVLAALRENSDIQANAFTGNGGRVSITTQGLFGIEPRESVTNLSDITASSEFGIRGLITVDDLGIDPVQRGAELPTEVAPPALSQGCTPGGGRGSFTNVSQGGIPLGPGDVRGSDRAWEDISPPIRIPDRPLTEAQNWTINNQGQVVLHSELNEGVVGLTCQTNRM